MRGLVVSAVLGTLFCIITHKLNLTVGMIASLNAAAGLLGFFLVKSWTELLSKLGFSQRPFTRQENTVIQTCVVACYGIAFSGGFGSYLIAMDDMTYKVIGVDYPDREYGLGTSWVIASSMGRPGNPSPMTGLLGTCGLTPRFEGIIRVAWLTLQGCPTLTNLRELIPSIKWTIVHGATLSGSQFLCSATLSFHQIMIMDYKLTYPNGTATAMLINSFHMNTGAELAGVPSSSFHELHSGNDKTMDKEGGVAFVSAGIFPAGKGNGHSILLGLRKRKMGDCDVEVDGEKSGRMEEAREWWLEKGNQTLVPSALVLPTPTSHLIHVIGKPKPQIPLDECSYCHQKGHWKHSCPNWGQSKAHKGRFYPSFCYNYSSLSHCVTLVSPISIVTANGSSMSVVSIVSISSCALSISDDQVTQKQIGTGCRVGNLYSLESLHIPLSSSSASCTTTSSFYLNQKSSLFFLWHSRLEEHSSTLDIADIPLPATSPKVSDCPPPPSTSSLPSLVLPAHLVYSRRRRIPYWFAVSGYVGLAAISTATIPSIFPPLKWYLILFSYIIAPALAFGNSYATGLTDWTVASTYGKISIFIVASFVGSDGGVIAGLASCGVIMSIVNTAADLMQDFKTGYLTQSSAKSMFVSQLIGTAMGCIISPLTFWMFWTAFDVGSPDGQFKAPFGVIYREMAILGVEGFSKLPKHCLALCCGFFIAALVINLLRDLTPTNFARFIPIPMAMGLTFYMGAYLAIDMFVGTVILFVWERMNRKDAEDYAGAVASGLICGDGIWTVPSAILSIFRVDPPICMYFRPSLIS
ncbi:YELLOW STRIPE like 6 [Actinidia rufa]|uniref:YELLOW STRIPE like 6 n=1 Tax=Actinidia rufa TaxID=165716 RepID=A0A7J0EB87_9ERIC|nr:YELLOW STRIPE like 6 [Actinidia rufa]